MPLIRYPMEYGGSPINEYSETYSRQVNSGRYRQNGDENIVHPEEMLKDSEDLFLPEFMAKYGKEIESMIWGHDLVEDNAKIRVYKPDDLGNVGNGHVYLSDIFGDAKGKEIVLYGIDALTMRKKKTRLKGKGYYDQMRSMHRMHRRTPSTSKGVIKRFLRRNGENTETHAGDFVDAISPGFQNNLRMLNIAIPVIKTGLDRKNNTKRDEQRDTTIPQERYMEVKDGSEQDLKELYMTYNVHDYFEASNNFRYNPKKFDRALFYKFRSKMYSNAQDNIIHYIPLAQRYLLDDLSENGVFDQKTFREYLRMTHDESAGIIEDTFRLIHEDTRAQTIIFYALTDMGANRGQSMKRTLLRQYLDKLIKKSKESSLSTTGKVVSIPKERKTLKGHRTNVNIDA